MNSIYKSPDNDPRPWTSSSVSAPGASTHQGMVYAIQHPFSDEMLYPTVGRCWSLGQSQMLENLQAWASWGVLTLKPIAIAQHSKISYVVHMKITKKLYTKIEPLLPVQRGNVVLDNRRFLEAIFYMLENGCKWRSLPRQFGKWSTVYKRFRRWAEAGVFQNVMLVLQREGFSNIDLSTLSCDSTFIKASPNASGALKKKDSKRQVEPKEVLRLKFTPLSAIQQR